MEKQKKEKGFIALQLPLEFQQKLQQIAECNCLSVSGIVRLMIGQYLHNPAKFNDLGLSFSETEKGEK